MSPGANLDAILRKAVADGVVPGVVAAASDWRGTLYRGAFGLAEVGARRAMTEDAIFDIASMTKPLTAVAAMQLIESGRLSLDDPAARYLPELAEPMVLEAFDPATGASRLRRAASPITVRHLFTHTSGFGYGFTSERLAQLRSHASYAGPVDPLLFDPGRAWLYGTSTDWLGKIVAALAGCDLEKHFRATITGPLGMDDTFYDVPAEKHPRTVNLQTRGPAGGFSEQPRSSPGATTVFRGGGGLHSTADDYLRFLRMLLNGGTLEGVRLLAPEAVAQMGQNQIGGMDLHPQRSVNRAVSWDFTFIGSEGDKFGLCFQITTRGTPGLRASGSLSWGGLFNTYFWVDPASGLAGVVLMQFLPFADPQALALCTEFERGVYRLATG